MVNHICVHNYLTDGFTRCQERYIIKWNYFFFKQIFQCGIWIASCVVWSACSGQGWVNQLDIYLTNLFRGRQKGEVVFFPHWATDLWDWRKESLSLDYESSVFQDWPAQLCTYSFNCIYAEPGALGIIVNEWAKVLGVQWKRQILEQTHYYTTQAGK